MFTLPLTTKVRQALGIGGSVVKCFKKTQVFRSSSSLSYCIDLVRNLDYENYLCSLLLPDNLRACAFAVRAFNVEVARIQEVVTEDHIMPMRFKFWDDRIDDIYNGKTIDHPVVQELIKAVRRHKLSKMFLKRLVTIRAKQLNRSTFKDMTEMEFYADQTNSPIYMLLLEASGIKDINCDHVASHLGKAQGLVNLVRGLPFNIKERLIMLPMSVLVKYNVSEENFLRMKVPDSDLTNIVFDIAKVAHSHLNIAHSLQEKIPSKCWTIFLPSVAVKEYLRRLEKHEFNVFAESLGIRNAILPIKLYWSKLTKTI